ncbi:MAG: cell division topological specificity factor MinE [Gammaproteobacteria bacterium]|nr:cell division topological specificity factor MinE [Gammaproteobacteria bacterium]
MGFLDYFRATPKSGKSATLAKERLQILVSHDRLEANSPSYLPKMKEELIEVIRKYVDVDQDAVSVKLEQKGSREMLELNVVLPD